MFFLCQARAKYLSVAKQMKAFEDRLYEEWKTRVEVILPGLLKRNLLVKPTDQPTASLPLIGEAGDPSIEAGTLFCCTLFFFGKCCCCVSALVHTNPHFVLVSGLHCNVYTLTHFL